ncbi:Crp/Fnr family transcriptional regulator [Desertivirga brevis]|uniref:Crp/Fnr family transcriptional regulator n=1 Tax=Desertivirga brevis TaxID=2810310 RepID=UPI001A970990|nr:Crp/Fnr family transcriptional regulator [Pedobacter sp. SYSU D00873]
MMTHPAIESLTAFISISTELKTLLSSKLTRQEYSPNQILVGGGQRATCIYFVEKGLLRSYYKRKSAEITRDFFQTGDFLIPPNFFRKTSCKDYIEAVDFTIVYTLIYEDLMEILKHHTEFHRSMLEILEYQYEKSMQRDQFLRITSAVERYRLFHSRYKTVSELATLPMISSYLNISRKHLSRVKNHEAFKKEK